MNELVRRVIFTGEIVEESTFDGFASIRLINIDKVKDAIRQDAEQGRTGAVRPYIDSIDDDPTAQVIDI